MTNYNYKHFQRGEIAIENDDRQKVFAIIQKAFPETGSGVAIYGRYFWYMPQMPLGWCSTDETTNLNAPPKIVLASQISLDDEQEKDGREIIGYKAPFDMFSGVVKKDTIYVTWGLTSLYRPIPVVGNKKLHDEALPKEIVETWEPVYKTEAYKELLFTANDLLCFANDIYADRPNDMQIYTRNWIGRNKPDYVFPKLTNK